MIDAAECPDEETLTAFVEQRLSDGQAGVVAEHVAGCARCAVAVELGAPSESLARALGGGEVAEGAPRFAGNRLGPYRIVARLGSGGMGEVYAARDERLDRLVAIKVLLPALAADPAVRARFSREARAAARLDHPSIVAVHSVEEHDGVPFLVMEHVDGQTLQAKVTPGGMEVAPLLALALPLVEAVAAAHDAGLVHRDLKPQNVMVTDGGRVKVLDFGLARARGGGVHPASTTLTAEGVIVGTLAYMSPEQAEGGRVDARSDVFALGVMLFELATGRRPFAGDSPAALLASILRDQPPAMASLRPGHPQRLEAIVQRCLRKDPAARYPDASALLADLLPVRREVDAPPPPTPPKGRRLAALLAGSALAVAALAVPLVLMAHRSPLPAPEPSAVLRNLRRVTFEGGRAGHPCWSPDGTWFVNDRCLGTNCWVERRGLASGLPPFLLGEGREPALSPDGKQVVLQSDQRVGGRPGLVLTSSSERGGGERIADGGHDPSWLPDGSAIVFHDELIDHPEDRRANSQSFLLELTGRQRRTLVVGDSPQPSVSPHGLRVAFFHNRAQGGGTRAIATAPLAGGAAVELTDEPAVDFRPVWSPDGRFLYFLRSHGAAAAVMRIAIDEASGRARGGPQLLWQGASEGPAELAVSPDGTRLLLALRSLETHLMRVPFDVAHEAAVGEAEEVADQVNSFSVASDRLVWSRSGPPEDLWTANLEGAAAHRLTDDASADRQPRLQPDGRRVIYVSAHGPGWGLWSLDLPTSGSQQAPAPTSLFPAQDGMQLAVFSPDARWIAVSWTTGTIGIFPVGPAYEEKPRYLRLGSGLRMWASDWSPDGAHLLGVRLGDGGHLEGIGELDLRTEEYRPISAVGDLSPHYFPDGRRVVLCEKHRILAARTDGSGSHTVLGVGHDRVRDPTLSPDGKWLYFVRERQAGDIWLAEIGP